ELVSAVAAGRRVIDGGKKLRVELQGDLARLLHARHRDAQVVIVLKRRTDEVSERLVFEDLPPGQVGDGGLLRDPFGPSEIRRRVHHRPLVIRAKRAGGQEQRQKENEKREPSRHQSRCSLLLAPGPPRRVTEGKEVPMSRE